MRRTEEQIRLVQIKKVLWITFGLNLLTAAPKLVYGHWTQSLGMVADGFHSLFDSSSNLIGLLALALMKGAAARRSDLPRKIEAVAAMGISLLLFVTVYEIVSQAYVRYHGGMPVRVTFWSFVIMAASMAVNFGVSRYEDRRGHELHSRILTADSVHTRSDVLASASVLASLGAVRLRWLWADAVAAVAISLLIAYSAYKIIAESLRVLRERPNRES